MKRILLVCAFLLGGLIVSVSACHVITITASCGVFVARAYNDCQSFCEILEDVFYLEELFCGDK
jgi:hypothetical protein